MSDPNINPKHSHLYSIFTMKCPRCKKTNLFTHQNPYNLRYLFSMEERCSVCHLKYESEIGFWWGAMYVAYALSCAIVLSLFVPLFFYFKIDVDNALIIDILITMCLIPLVFRFARALWVHLFYEKAEDMPQKNL